MDKEKLLENILAETGTSKFSLKESGYEERLAYISMISSLAWADGSIDDRELEIINAIAKEAGADIENQIDIILLETKRFNLANYDTWLDSIVTEPLKIGLMVDMFLTSFADTMCMQSETIFMKYIAGKIGVSDNTYNIIRRNVEEYLTMKKGENAVNYELRITKSE